MHGRIKVRTTQEQQLIKQKEQQKKLVAYRHGMKQILSTRNPNNYDSTSLSICSQLLVVNPDIYTLWNYRKEVILMVIKEAAKKQDGEGENDEEKTEKTVVDFLENELRLTEQCLMANPKSYGSWHHRYWVLDHHPSPNWQREFDLCNKYFTMDDRNFHCWDYRRLIVNKIGLTLSQELDFSTERININFSNYSSWHYRSTLLTLLKNDEKEGQMNVQTELDLVQNAVFTDPADTSAWFYLRWVLSNPSVTKDQKQHLLGNLNELQQLEPDCKWIIIAKCWLTGSLILLDKNYTKEDHVQFYKDLIKLDPYRKGHYEDCLKLAQN